MKKIIIVISALWHIESFSAFTEKGMIAFGTMSAAHYTAYKFGQHYGFDLHSAPILKLVSKNFWDALLTWSERTLHIVGIAFNATTCILCTTESLPNPTAQTNPLLNPQVVGILFAHLQLTAPYFAGVLNSTKYNVHRHTQELENTCNPLLLEHYPNFITKAKKITKEALKNENIKQQLNRYEYALKEYCEHADSAQLLHDILTAYRIGTVSLREKMVNVVPHNFEALQKFSDKFPTQE